MPTIPSKCVCCGDNITALNLVKIPSTYYDGYNYRNLCNVCFRTQKNAAYKRLRSLREPLLPNQKLLTAPLLAAPARPQSHPHYQRWLTEQIQIIQRAPHYEQDDSGFDPKP